MQDPLLDCEDDIRSYLEEHATTQCPPLLAQAMEYAVFPGGAQGSAAALHGGSACQ